MVGRWSSPSGILDAPPPVADGVLVDLSLWGTSIINLVAEWFGLEVARIVVDECLAPRRN
jgi:hypothetical protein